MTTTLYGYEISHALVLNGVLRSTHDRYTALLQEAGINPQPGQSLPFIQFAAFKLPTGRKKKKELVGLFATEEKARRAVAKRIEKDRQAEREASGIAHEEPEQLVMELPTDMD